MQSIENKVVILVAAAMISACSSLPTLGQRGNPDAYARGQVMTQGKVIQGLVMQVRDVTIKSGGAPMLAGAAAGGLGGALLGRNSSKKKWISGAGVLVGALAGASGGTSIGQEIVVLIGDGSSRVIVQEPGELRLNKGTKVLVLVNGMESRIVSVL